MKSGGTEGHRIKQAHPLCSSVPSVLRSCFGLFESNSHSGFVPTTPSLRRHRRHHIKQNPWPAPHFLHADTFVVPMFSVAFFLRGRIRIESVGNDAQRPVALVLGVTAGDVRHYRTAGKIFTRDRANGAV